MDNATALKIKNVVQFAAHAERHPDGAGAARRALQLALWQAELEDAGITSDAAELRATYFEDRKVNLRNFIDPATGKGAVAGLTG